MAVGEQSVGKQETALVSGQSFPIARKKKLCYALKSKIRFCVRYPYPLQSCSIYECGFLRVRMDFYSGRSTSTLRTVSNACPFPQSHISVGCRSHVYPMYIQAHISPPCAIFNQCAAKIVPIDSSGQAYEVLSHASTSQVLIQ